MSGAGLHIPRIRALDLRWPLKYFGHLDSDPEDSYRAEMRLERRRVSVGFPPRTHDQICHAAGRYLMPVGSGQKDPDGARGLANARQCGDMMRKSEAAIRESEDDEYAPIFSLFGWELWPWTDDAHFMLTRNRVTKWTWRRSRPRKDGT